MIQFIKQKNTLVYRIKQVGAENCKYCNPIENQTAKKFFSKEIFGYLTKNTD